MPLGTVSLVIPFPQKGNGILFLCGFIFAIIIPFPQKGNGILLLCGFILAIIIIIDVVVVVKVFVLNNGDISLIFQDISMKLGGHIGHGPNSSYHHF